MTDTLRTRIASAIMDTCHGLYVDDAVNAADAVIRELGLTRVVRSERVPKHRYVTEWVQTDD